jgi:hypothetical protein
LQDGALNLGTVSFPFLLGVARLDSPGIAVMTAAAQLSFRHYSTETTFDGGVLEIAVGSGSFTDIIAAGGNFVEGGYTQRSAAPIPSRGDEPGAALPMVT